MKRNVCIINCFKAYDCRVKPIYDYFKAHNYNVRVLTSNFSHIEKCVIEDKKEDYEYVKTLKYSRNISIGRILSHIVLAKNIFKKIKHEQFDILWVLVPPNSFVKETAKYIKKHQKTKLVFDIIDVWPESFPIAKIKDLFVFKYWKNIRDNDLKLADVVVTECNLYQKKLPKLDKIQTVYLSRKLETFKDNPKLPNGQLNVCYLGSINNIIDIQAVKNILLNIQKFKPVELHIIGDGEKRNELIEECKKSGANVIYHGAIFDAEKKQEIFNICHYGLNIMKKTVNVGLTMKSMDYFEAGLPIINNIMGDTWDMVQERSLGVNIDNSSEYSWVNSYDESIRKHVRANYEELFSEDVFNKQMEIIENGYFK